MINVIGGSDKVIIEQSFDRSIIQRVENITPGVRITGESFRKIDYLFFVIYDFRLGVSDIFSKYTEAIPEDFPYGFEFRIILPGSIRKTNAEKVEKNAAIWLLDRGDKLDLYARSVKIRYWIFIVFLYPFYFLVIKKRRK